MKRLITLVVMVLYLVPAFGITVSAHYCSGKLADVSVFVSGKRLSCACGSAGQGDQAVVKKKCCEQLVYSLKLETQQLKELKLGWEVSDFSFVSQRITSFFIHKEHFVIEAPLMDYSPELPPGRCKEPIYIQNDSFLI